MRWAIFSDVHANLAALDAAIADAEALGATHYACAGDILGYGAQPVECVRRLLERNVACIAGNHEGMILGRIGFARVSREAVVSTLRSRVSIDRASRRWIAALPAVLELEGRILLTHGYLDDPETYLSTRSLAEAAFDRLERERPSVRVLVSGHTHTPMLYRRGAAWTPPAEVVMPGVGPILLNPGSVGRAKDREPRAHYALIDIEGAWVRFRAVRYEPHGSVVAGLVTRLVAPKFTHVRGR